MIPKALVTTTSVRLLPAVGVKEILTLSEVPTVISLSSKPTEVITRTVPEATPLIVNLPSASAVTPVLVPFTVTEANGIALPFASVTVPETFRF